MAIALNDNTKIEAPKPSEERYLKPDGTRYIDANDVLTTVPISRRYIDMIVSTNQGFLIFDGGVQDSDLKPYVVGSNLEIDDTITSLEKVWSSQKTQDELNLKANDSEISLVGKSNNYNDLDNKLDLSTVFTYIVNDQTIDEILNQVNTSTAIDVKDPSSSLIKAVNFGSLPTPPTTKIYKIITNPLNNYNVITTGLIGQGQQQLVADNLELIYFQDATAQDIAEDPNNTVVDLGDIGTTAIDEHINNLTTPLTIADSATTVTLINAISNGSPISYIYIGSGGTYGDGQVDTITMSDLQLLEQETQFDNSTGLEAIDEGNGIGWRLKGRDPDNYGDIGEGAVDLSFSNGASTTRGATGAFSHAEGINNIASGESSHAEGIINITEGDGAHVEGQRNTANGANSHAEGFFNTSRGNNSHAEGEGNFARADGEHSGGMYGTDYTPTNTDTDRLVNYGNGISKDSRSDAFTIFKNGAVRIFRATLASIQNAMAGMLIFNSDDNNRPTIHNGTDWQGLAYKSEAGEPLITVELLEVLETNFFASQNFRINNIDTIFGTNINSTLSVNGANYTLGDLIPIGAEINITVSEQAVINLNVKYE